jgi:hypothetical protein
MGTKTLPVPKSCVIAGKRGEFGPTAAALKGAHFRSTMRCRRLRDSAHDLLAMQKVMGSSSIIRFVALRKKSPKRVCLASACLIA